MIDKLLAKDVTKQRITQDESTKIRERLTTSTRIEDLSKVDFVVEAVPVSYFVLPSDLSNMGQGNRKPQNQDLF